MTIAEGAKPTTNFKKATAATIDALRRNAALDREEIDLLWWVQLNRSRLLGRAASAMDEPLRLVALAIGAAVHLRRLPADLHYELVLRTVDKDQELDFNELTGVIGEDRIKLVASFDSNRAARHPSVFPLLNTLATAPVDVPEAESVRAGGAGPA